MLTLKEIGYTVSSLNTAGIYQSKQFEEVPVVIKNGHIMNPEILKVGDAILYVGNDPKRHLQIGHVEWIYEVKGTAETVKPKTTYPAWLESAGRWFYRLANGKNAHGWLEIPEKKNPAKKHWYFFNNKTGEMLTDTWIKGQSSWYYVNKDGAMPTSTWILGKDKKWYYVTSSGLMATDSYIQDTKGRGFCYVDKDGIWDGRYLNAVNSGNVVS
ncbi:hypothetical protein BXO88_11075 [Oribacterium sp. C9]|uniref:hypothetical protein n=1 Tax=Oribacterium sp. C9 TaxID=1943579 RepID=UPI00098FE4F7|nr:hypothetical protein [Oribacterium sp. C9]OON85790.1 hypothetical protein BXO88_11075 [Oribacterium sp. C9]